MNILWIDDDPERYFIIKDSKPDETNIFFAHGEEQIRHYLTNLELACVILDADMPLMDGLKVLEVFHFPNVPIILCSANPDKAKRQFDILHEDGYDAHIIPINSDRFRQVLTFIYRKIA